MSRISSTSIIIGVLFFAASVYGAGLCTGYPKMYNGKPCASTTRYWDGQMGACGCGSGNTNPFSWQWTKPTAAASAPVFGSGTWCGSGCGKCSKLTPTGVGASVAGKGATNTNSLVVKVTNLCPYGGNEEWCAMDINSHDYDAHFDLMDQNMNGIITAQGWDNPEVVYEEVDCASNGFAEWSCQCASGSKSSSSPISGGTTKPTSAAKPAATTTTTAPAKATTTKAPATTTKAPASTTKAPASTTPTAPAKATTTKAPATVTSTKAPATVTTTAAPPTAGPKSSTSSSSPSSLIKINLKPGVNSWWLGFTLDTPVVTKVEIMDNNGAYPTWTTMQYHGDQYWGMFFIQPTQEMKLPVSVRFSDDFGAQTIAPKVITAWTNTGEVISTSCSL